jgi:hypothetical protein
LTLRQPTERHGGNAGIDEEVTIMVSRSVASLDVWLEQAETVLREQREQSLSPSSSGAWHQREMISTVTLGTFEDGIVDILSGLCGRPGRWVLICYVVESVNRFWQALAYEDGSLKVEAVSNAYLAGDECHSEKNEELLTKLGWGRPSPPDRPNWWRVEATTSPSIEDVARQAVRTLREVFGVGDEDRLEIVTFDLVDREGTPASQQIDDRRRVFGSRGWAPSFVPTSEPWGPYFRTLWPDYLRPRSEFISWKYSTTGKGMAESLWAAREVLRGQWMHRHGSDPEGWPISHPPAVLWLPYVAHSACLKCTWLDEGSGSSPQAAGQRAREHSIAEGSDPQAVHRMRVPIGERNGPIDRPLGIKWAV